MIDINKKYRTRDGREVRIYALDGGGALPVHGACRDDETGVWVLSRWKENGSISLSDFPSDLVEVKPRIQRTVWLALYPKGVTGFCLKGSAVEANCLARYKVEIDCEEGEGL